MDIQDLNGPFRATKLWNEAIQLFRSGMPVRRHRWHMRCYNKSFSGAEAVAWFHKALVRSPYFGDDVTHHQTQQLLSKFMKADVFHSVKGSLTFKESDIYVFENAAINELACSMRVPLATRVDANNAQVLVSSKRQSYETTECAKPTTVHKQGVLNEQKLLKNNYSNKVARQNLGLQGKEPREQGKAADIKCKRQKQPSQCGEFDSCTNQEEALKQFIMSKLEELLPGLNLKLWIPFRLIDPRWIIINSYPQYIYLRNQSNLPVWVLGAIKDLLNPEERETVYSYDGFEKDVFNAVRDYFGQLSEPLISYQLYDLMIQTHLHFIQMDVKQKMEYYHSSIPASESVENLVLNMSSPCKELVNTSKITSTVLPPNSCFETAFTSDIPITRIVPQSSIDTIQLGFQHLYTCSPNHRTHSEVYLEHKQLKKPDVPIKFSTKPNQNVDNVGTKFIKSTGDNENRTCSSMRDPLLKVRKSCDQNTVRRAQSVAQGMNSLHRKNSFLKRTKSSIDRCLASAITKDCNKSTRNQNAPFIRSSIMKDANSKSIDNLMGSRGYINFGMSQSLDDLTAADESTIELDYTKAMQSLQKLVHYSKKSTTSLSQSSEDEALSHHTESTYSSSDESCKQCVSNEDIHPYRPFTGEAWDKKTEALAEFVYQLLLLLLPPERKASLSLLLAFISHHKLCDLSGTEIMQEFCGSVLNPPKETQHRYDDHMIRYGLVHFLVSHHKNIMSDLRPDLVQKIRHVMNVSHTGAADIVYCERLTQQQFEAQKESGSREAISELLKQIINDKKMNPKKKKKQLKMFQAAYPHIYMANFPADDGKQKLTTTGLQYISCKIRNLRN